MKANNYYTIIALVGIIGLTIALADNPKPIDPKEKELNELLKKSQERLKKVNFLAKKIDEVATTEVTGMKESIETLEEEKQQLIEEKEQLTTVLHETQAIIKRDTITPSPFQLEPIVPLSED
jgi:ABC-type phosphate transport system auxiliary subunit